MAIIPAAARYVPPSGGSAHRLVLFDVMDTLVRDPFFMGFEKDLFNIDGGIKNLFTVKDQASFVAFEKGEISEAQHFETCALHASPPISPVATAAHLVCNAPWSFFRCTVISDFNDRRPCDGTAIKAYLRSHYEWLPGMRELATDLHAAGVPMATFSNYPKEWACIVEDSVQLSTLVPWAFISGEQGVRKPSPEAFEAALKVVGRTRNDVVFVDDSKTNTDAASALGIPTVHFEGAEALRPALRSLLGLSRL